MSMLLKTLQKAHRDENATEAEVAPDDTAVEAIEEPQSPLASESQESHEGFDGHEKLDASELQVRSDDIDVLLETDAYIDKLTLELDDTESATGLDNDKAGLVSDAEAVTDEALNETHTVSSLGVVEDTAEKVTTSGQSGLSKIDPNTVDDESGLLVESSKIDVDKHGSDDSDTIESSDVVEVLSIEDQIIAAQKSQKLKRHVAVASGAIVLVAALFYGVYALDSTSTANTSSAIGSSKTFDQMRDTDADRPSAQKPGTANTTATETSAMVNANRPESQGSGGYVLADTQSTAEFVSVDGDNTAVTISRRNPAETYKNILGEAATLFQRKDYQSAASRYREVLKSHDSNVDALNGLGAVSLASGDIAAAQRYFYQVLEADASNHYARRGLLKTLSNLSPHDKALELEAVVERFPDSASAAFALGQHYAAQSDWHRAQQAFFSAHSLAGDNQDYQYHLAVALDQIGKHRLALQFYQQSLIPKNQGATFSEAAVARRIQQLRKQTSAAG